MRLQKQFPLIVALSLFLFFGTRLLARFFYTSKRVLSYTDATNEGEFQALPDPPKESFKNTPKKFDEGKAQLKQKSPISTINENRIDNSTEADSLFKETPAEANVVNLSKTFSHLEKPKDALNQSPNSGRISNDENGDLNQVSLNVHIISRGRKEPLLKNPQFVLLWSSLNKATTISSPINFHIHCIADIQQSNSLSDFKIVHGPVKISYHNMNSHIKSLLSPVQKYKEEEFVILLDDNHVVSENFFQIAQLYSSTYFDALRESCFGVALSALVYDEVNKRYWNFTQALKDAYLYEKRDKIESPSDIDYKEKPSIDRSSNDHIDKLFDNEDSKTPNRIVPEDSGKLLVDSEIHKSPNSSAIKKARPPNVDSEKAHPNSGSKNLDSIPDTDSSSYFDHKISPFIAQYPQHRGVMISSTLWKRFIQYLKNLSTDFDPIIPDSYTNRWVKEQNWKKYLMRFMYEKGFYMIYPNFPNGSSLVSSDKDLKLFNLADVVQSSSTESDPDSIKMKLPSIDRLLVFNMHMKKVTSIKALKEGINPSAFDKCTMIMNVYDRVNTLPSRIRHYQSLPRLDKIIIVWNHPKLQPTPEIQDGIYKVPVEIIKMQKDSLNNRYYPFKMNTDCVISMDDDWEFPHVNMEYAMTLFRCAFFNQIIGFKVTARSHKYLKNQGTYEYTSYDNAASIILPSGAVFHRKYLSMYTNQLPSSVKRFVDERKNCEDILFSMMITNYTRSCPVVIDMFAKAKDMNSGKGLWKRPNHFKERSECITNFVGIFGKPPKRSPTLFKKDNGGNLPFVGNLKCED